MPDKPAGTYTIATTADIPSTYIKNAEVSESGDTLTLTKQDDTTVMFQGGGGGTPSNMVTTDTTQTISANKTFSNKITANTVQANYLSSGTSSIAVVNLMNPVSIDAAQTITGLKKFANNNVTSFTPANGLTTGTYSTVGYDGFTTRNGSLFLKTEYNGGSYANKFGYKMNAGNGTKYISLPDKTGTLATTDDVPNLDDVSHIVNGTNNNTILFDGGDDSNDIILDTTNGGRNVEINCSQLMYNGNEVATKAEVPYILRYAFSNDNITFGDGTSMGAPGWVVAE